MREVILHGFLTKRFGRSFALEVVSLAEAVRALGSQLPGFRKAINDNNFRIVIGKDRKTGLHLDENHLKMNLPKGNIHIIPATQGAKRGGFGKIIAGILIAAVAWWNPAGLFSAAGALGGVGITAGNAAVMGLGIAVAGLGQVLTPTQKAKQPDGSNTDSFSLDGVLNVGEQGVPVPLIYGETMVGSVIISAGMTTTPIPIGAAAPPPNNVSLPDPGWNAPPASTTWPVHGGGN